MKVTLHTVSGRHNLYFPDVQRVRYYVGTAINTGASALRHALRV